MTDWPIDPALVLHANRQRSAELGRDYETLGEKLARRGIPIDAITRSLSRFAVAIPTWGVGTGGTRFARFPMPGEPRDVFEKLEDCAAIWQLARATPTLSPHFPWDAVDEPAELRARAAAFGLGFDAVNSNTFQDLPGQVHSYKYGSLAHVDARVREQAIAHNLDCIRLGEALGSKALTVWIADGSNFPGQQHFARSLSRYLDSMRRIYAALPEDWSLFIEHKLYEPGLYSSVIADWGTSYVCARELGPRAKCLVDLGHHAPTTNIEQLVARLISLGRLGGFHFNDSKYGDDDLDSGSIDPFQIFLVMNELVDAELRDVPGFEPAYMIDQSHNVTDPIESLISSAQNLQRAFAQALLVDREALLFHQERDDALLARETLMAAFQIDVGPIVARARAAAGGAIDPLAVFRASGYRERKAKDRPQELAGRAGIV